MAPVQDFTESRVQRQVRMRLHTIRASLEAMGIEHDMLSDQELHDMIISANYTIQQAGWDADEFRFWALAFRVMQSETVGVS